MAITTVKSGALEYLTADSIAVPHCFTTRLGGVSRGHLASLNLGAHRGDDPENVAANFRILANAVGFDPNKLVLTRQIHSDIVRQVQHTDSNGFDNHDYPDCDALITNDPGTALAVFSADCTPILLHDPVTGAVGAVHAGWRGTAARLAEKTVFAITEAFGCKSADICAAIGPNIAQCCFQTDADVPAAMKESFGAEAERHIRSIDGKYYVNLKTLNALLLQYAGVVNIDISADCTACNPDRYWSHRVRGRVRGSQGAIILCQEASRGNEAFQFF